MKHIFKTDFKQRIKKAKRILLFLDYDGTLSPIVKEPHQAHLSPATKKILKNLVLKKNIVLIVITGRSIVDIKKKVGLKNIMYAGNHGLQVLVKNKVVLTKPADLKLYLKILKKAKSVLRKKLEPIKSLIFEDKGLMFAVHYRNIKLKDVSSFKRMFKEAVKPFIETKKMKIGHGKKFFDLRPAASGNKGDAYLVFLKQLKKRKGDLKIFIGDDLTDEDIFKRICEPDMGIRVKRKKGSKAGYFLNNTRQVRELLAVF